jgi:N-methylhydantoinase A/oxoprolinase/acetone carboxylase beta subunit
MAKLKLGVDVGGTFTDVVGINEDGKVYFAKTPSTPEDQSIGVLNGIRALLEELGVAPDCVTGVAHGTTVATNTLLERNGAVTALITTKGFRDVLDIGRQSRPELYDLHAIEPPPAPIVVISICGNFTGNPSITPSPVIPIEPFCTIPTSNDVPPRSPVIIL